MIKNDPKWRERERDRQTDRQIDRQTDRDKKVNHHLLGVSK